MENNQEEQNHLLPEQEAELLKLQETPADKKELAPAAKTPEPSQEFIGMVAIGYAGLFAILAGRLGNHWNLAPDEVESLAKPTCMVIEKYFPKVAESIGVEAMLVGAVAAVIFPRVMMQLTAIEGEVVEGGDKPQHNAQ